VDSSRCAPGGNQTGVNKLQNLGPDRRADRTRAGSNHKLQINIKLQCPNDQNQFFLEFCACLLVFVCYLEFVIWCLSDILINSINKYFAKNGQKTFIKGLMLD
jgi:hypothetical protein